MRTPVHKGPYVKPGASRITASDRRHPFRQIQKQYPRARLSRAPLRGAGRTMGPNQGHPFQQTQKKGPLGPFFCVWRRGWDSNPRRGLTLGGFQDRCIQPLCHPSKTGGSKRTHDITRFDLLASLRDAGGGIDSPATRLTPAGRTACVLRSAKPSWSNPRRGTAVSELRTAAFNHSATPPVERAACYRVAGGSQASLPCSLPKPMQNMATLILPYAGLPSL
jgi:hypothetical protein